MSLYEPIRKKYSPENVQTNSSIRVNIWMINTRGEGELGWLERIVSWKVDVEEEHST